MIRPLRHHRLWLALWALAIAGVIVISLIPPPPLPSAPEADKLGHFLAYFALVALAVQIFASRAALIVIALLLAALGLGLEFAQGLLTTTRLFDLYDALANAVGVLAGLMVAATPAASWLQRLERRLWQ